MSFAKYEFKPFTDARFEATRDAWLADAAEGLAFPPEVERLQEWVDSHRQHKENDAAAYGVFAKGKNVALGISEVIVHRRSVHSKWVKMLRLSLKPSVDAELQDGEPDKAMDVFVASISGVLVLQLQHQASTLKIYGRTHQQLSFLKALVARLNGKPGQHTASIQGRFLVLESK